MNQVPGAEKIARPVDRQPSELALYTDSPKTGEQPCSARVMLRNRPIIFAAGVWKYFQRRLVDGLLISHRTSTFSSRCWLQVNDRGDEWAGQLLYIV